LLGLEIEAEAPPADPEGEQDDFELPPGAVETSRKTLQ
jgi:hypothetical protein